MGADLKETRMSLPESLNDTTVAVLGGTGPQGRGLARRFAAAGLPVVIGSRSVERADDAARTLAEATGGQVTGADNAAAAAAGDIVVVSVPWDGHAELLRDLAPALAGKVVVDCVNPLGFDKRGAFVLEVEEGSAAEQAAALLPDSIVVGAFHNVSAVKLEDPDVAEVDTDVLVLGEGENREACELIQDLAGVIPGVRGVYAGRLRNAHQVEALTANLISVNRRYNAHAGIRVTDI
jgi:NADPH-dependent F420 reductase